MAKKKKLKKKKSASSKKPLKVKRKKLKKKPKKKKISAKKKIVKGKTHKAKPVPKKNEIQKKAKEKATKKIIETIETITSEKAVPSVNEAAKEKARQKALAKAKEAILAKEKQKNSIQPIDKAAAEKQLKLAEPKHKLILEYIIHSSPALLYEFITSPSGLSEWFADNVNITGSNYSFLWEGAEQKAKVLAVKENKSIRLQWTDRAPNTYFELRIEKNELTEELSLIITDFAETEEEKNSLEVLWQGQVQLLMKVIGSKI